MKARIHPGVILGLVALTLERGGPAFAADAGGAAEPSSTGTIVGRVSNAATNVYLDGAQVTLQPPGRTTITGREGEFVFSGVPRP